MERAMVKFKFSKNDLPYFRTIHSLAFQQLSLGQCDIMNLDNYKEIGKVLGLEFTGKEYSLEDAAAGKGNGDKFVFLDNLARTNLRTLQDQYQLIDDDINWFQLKQFSDTLKQYKKDTGKIDFTDILENYTKDGSPINVEIAIIDEAQDLSPLQWKVAFHAFSGAKTIIVAGDDDQAIYQWSGADVNLFLNFTKNVEVLNLSHRLPRKIFELANGISKKIKIRIDKKWNPRPEDGSIHWHNSPEGVDVTEGNWLLLSRSICFLNKLEELAQLQGVPYTIFSRSAIDINHIEAIQGWEALRKGKSIPYKTAVSVYSYIQAIKKGHKSLSKMGIKTSYTLEDLKVNHGLLTTEIWHEALVGIPLIKREYYLSILRRGRSLLAPPKVHINTIHGVKGGEADNILLMTDITKRTYDEYLKNSDNEHRVFYTGVTRAKHNLHLVMPQTTFYYDI